MRLRRCRGRLTGDPGDGLELLGERLRRGVELLAKLDAGAVGKRHRDRDRTLDLLEPPPEQERQTARRRPWPVLRKSRRRTGSGHGAAPRSRRRHAPSRPEHAARRLRSPRAVGRGSVRGRTTPFTQHGRHLTVRRDSGASRRRRTAEAAGCRCEAAQRPQRGRRISRGSKHRRFEYRARYSAPTYLVRGFLAAIPHVAGFRVARAWGSHLPACARQTAASTMRRRAVSSAGQSACLTRRRSQVRALHRPFGSAP